MRKVKIVGMIPAHGGSLRYHNKLLALICSLKYTKFDRNDS